MQEFLQICLQNARQPCIGCRALVLFDRFAVIQDRDTVEEQNVLCIKRQPAAKPLRLHIADIDQRYFRVAPDQERCKAAGE